MQRYLVSSRKKIHINVGPKRDQALVLALDNLYCQATPQLSHINKDGVWDQTLFVPCFGESCAGAISNKLS